MRRFQLAEIEDQPWLPASIRDALTDYLQFTYRLNNPYRPIVPRLRDAILRCGGGDVVDLCSGAGGPWLPLLRDFGDAGTKIHICLTDKFPNTSALEHVRAKARGTVTFHAEPVDAMSMPPVLRGFRTLFSGFHHFRPRDARRILADAVASRQGIGIFEATHRSAKGLLLMLVIPLMVLLSTPFIRPFRWSRLFWTYLVPVVPLAALFDGVVSSLRTYTPDELRRLAAGLADDSYEWQIGEERGSRTPMPLTYLIGCPKR